MLLVQARLKREADARRCSHTHVSRLSERGIRPSPAAEQERNGLVNRLPNCFFEAILKSMNDRVVFGSRMSKCAAWWSPRQHKKSPTQRGTPETTRTSVDRRQCTKVVDKAITKRGREMRLKISRPFDNGVGRNVHKPLFGRLLMLVDPCYAEIKCPGRALAYDAAKSPATHQIYQGH